MLKLLNSLVIEEELSSLCNKLKRMIPEAQKKWIYQKIEKEKSLENLAERPTPLLKKSLIKRFTDLFKSSDVYIYKIK